MPDEDLPIIEFTTEARCDGCGAQAYAQAVRDGQTLLFCGHHIEEHEKRLIAEDWKVTIDTEGLYLLRYPDPELALV